MKPISSYSVNIQIIREENESSIFVSNPGFSNSYKDRLIWTLDNRCDILAGMSYQTRKDAISWNQGECSSSGDSNLLGDGWKLRGTIANISQLKGFIYKRQLDAHMKLYEP
ncbi:Uncharacterized protein Fot_03729 [Forsythia ovata]|uniref:Uncharacterized protein n=1 Tax=Forsythia ovata TaxID=205694 RepID=A0ABD1XAI7_9LAMI